MVELVFSVAVEELAVVGNVFHLVFQVSGSRFCCKEGATHSIALYYLIVVSSGYLPSSWDGELTSATSQSFVKLIWLRKSGTQLKVGI